MIAAQRGVERRCKDRSARRQAGAPGHRRRQRVGGRHCVSGARGCRPCRGRRSVIGLGRRRLKPAGLCSRLRVLGDRFVWRGVAVDDRGEVIRDARIPTREAAHPRRCAQRAAERGALEGGRHEVREAGLCFDVGRDRRIGGVQRHDDRHADRLQRERRRLEAMRATIGHGRVRDDSDVGSRGGETGEELIPPGHILQRAQLEPLKRAKQELRLGAGFNVDQCVQCGASLTRRQRRPPRRAISFSVSRSSSAASVAFSRYSSNISTARSRSPRSRYTYASRRYRSGRCVP